MKRFRVQRHAHAHVLDLSVTALRKLAESAGADTGGGSLGAEEPPSVKIHYKLSRGGFTGGGGGALGVITNLYHLCTC